ASDVLGTAFPAEGILSLRSRAEAGGFFTIGGASGITRGAGVPNWRVFVGGGFGRIQGEAPPPPPPVVETCADGSLPLEGMTIAEGCYSPLTIAVMVGDTPATGTLTVTGPAGTEVVEAAQSGWITKGLPGDQYSVTAIGDGCLAGQAKRAMGDGPTRIVVPLAPVRPTTLVVDVVDQDGAPIEGASLEFTGGPTACGPDSGATASGGRLTTRAGAGQYQLVARAASYATYLGQHAVPPDATDHRLQVVLQTTLVEVTAEQIVILDKVYFETGKSVIKADSFELLNQIATTIQTVESIDQVEIAGHTDSRGSDAMNLSLSQSRAESVRTYLISKGVTPDRLVAKGYGETTPIASNNDAAGRESNRRVEFNLIDAPTQDTDGGAQ
ncbi:MAG: outer membrane protein OmpA-like peptidoglycan-associated protein, partial [Myxococcota bacterium]